MRSNNCEKHSEQLKRTFEKNLQTFLFGLKRKRKQKAKS